MSNKQVGVNGVSDLGESASGFEGSGMLREDRQRILPGEVLQGPNAGAQWGKPENTLTPQDPWPGTTGREWGRGGGAVFKSQRPSNSLLGTNHLSHLSPGVRNGELM